MSGQKFIDGCHRYGWLLTIVINLLMASFVIGEMRQEMSDLTQRVARMEEQLEQYRREIYTFGINK